MFRLLTDLALTRCRRGRPRDVELLALHHQVRVLRRQVGRTAWRPGDRYVLALLSWRLPRAAWGVLPVRAETLLRWHRELVRRRWAAFGRHRGPGRPPLPAEVRGLIERHLEQVLHEYAEHDNTARPHRALGLRPSVARGHPVPPGGEIDRRNRLGGLIREYERRAE